MCDFFFRVEDLDIGNYGDDNKPYTGSPGLDVALKKLKKCTVKKLK